MDSRADSRNWTDQPNELTSADVVLSTSLDFPRAGLMGVEVRSVPAGFWYLTIGNLFGSQTIRCKSAEDVFRAINAALKATPDKAVQVAPYGEIMKP